LSQLSIFTNLDPGQLEVLRGMMDTVTLPAGTRVFDQGERTEYLYLVISGEVSVRFKPYDGPAITVATVRPGGVFGWSAALGRATYTSSAHAVSETEAYRVLGISLQRLCECDPDTGGVILERLAAVVTERLSSTPNQIVTLLAQGLDSEGDCGRRSNKNGKS
jgi:CRP-like cAMP-binding protein